MEKLKELAKRTEEVMKKAKEEAKEAFTSELKQVFINHPELTVLKWNQYTPYFNDGETCEFGVGGLTISNSSPDNVTSYGDLKEPSEGYFAYDMDYGTEGREKYPDLSDLNKFMQSELGHEVCLFAFGDHVEVTVTPSGAITEEYNHD